MAFVNTREQWARRLAGELPRSWVGQQALLPGDPTWTLLRALMDAWVTNRGALDYVKLQTRLRTATGDNLELIADDFLGDFPRIMQLGLARESDQSYIYRIIQAVIGPKNTLAALTAALNNYFILLAAVGASTLDRLGLDVGVGGLDTGGGLDIADIELAISLQPRREAVVFDMTSDPVRGAAIGLTDRQFCVFLGSGVPASGGFYLKYAYLSFDALAAHRNFTVLGDAPDPYVKSIVDHTRAAGFQPVYAEITPA